LLVLLGAHHILYLGRIRVKGKRGSSVKEIFFGIIINF
jgi:hypothetical protein